MEQNEQLQKNQKTEFPKMPTIKQPSSFSLKYVVILFILIVFGLGMGMSRFGQNKETTIQPQPMPSTQQQITPQPTPTTRTVTFNYTKRHYDQNQILYSEGKFDYPAEVKNISDEKLVAFDCHETTYSIADLRGGDGYATGDGARLNVPIKQIIRDAALSLNWLSKKRKSLQIYATFCESADRNLIYWLTKDYGREDYPDNKYVPTRVYFFTRKFSGAGGTLITTIPVDSTSHWSLQPLQLTADNHFYFLDDYRDDDPYPQGSQNFVVFDVNLSLKNSYKIIMQKDCTVTVDETPIKCIDK